MVFMSPWLLPMCGRGTEPPVPLPIGKGVPSEVQRYDRFPLKNGGGLARIQM